MKESNFFSDSNSDKEEALIECLKCGNFFSSSYQEKCPECEKEE